MECAFRGTLNGFCYTRHQAHEADHWSRQRYWKVAARKKKLRCFRIGKYLNHCVIIVVFIWSSSTYAPHINNSGQDSLTKTLFELHFRSRLEARSYRTASQYPENNCCAICNKTTEQPLIKICLRWLPVTKQHKKINMSNYSPIVKFSQQNLLQVLLELTFTTNIKNCLILRKIYEIHLVHWITEPLSYRDEHWIPSIGHIKRGMECIHKMEWRKWTRDSNEAAAGNVHREHKYLPWDPEDIFFWSIFRGEAALTRRKAPRRKK